MSLTIYNFRVFGRMTSISWKNVPIATEKLVHTKHRENSEVSFKVSNDEGARD